MRHSRVLGLVLLTFVIDQISKYYVLEHASHLPKEIAPFFTIDLVWNTGISFGFLNQSTIPFMTHGLTVLIIIILLYIMFLLIKNKGTLARFSLSLIMGGALGNLMDRLYRGAVVDFLDIHIGSHHWPAFNIADSAICLGVALFMWAQFRGERF